MRTGRPTTYPAECAIYAYLRSTGRPAESTEIAAAVHRVWKVVCDALRNLHECGLIHIAAWRSVTIGGGHPAKVWAFGPGKDTPKPPIKDVRKVRNASRKRRRQAVIDQYGKDIAKRIFCSRANGGSDKIVLDGRVIYERKRVL